MPIATRIRGPARLKVLQLHRLLEFERVYTRYMEGKTTASHVKARATKMLAVGLPMRLR